MADQSRSGGDTFSIYVRTLTGESTTVQVSSEGTIHDLKIALKSSFLPASSSPNFHLFFKVMLLILYSFHSFFLSDLEFRFLNQPFSGRIWYSYLLFISLSFVGCEIEPEQ